MDDTIAKFLKALVEYFKPSNNLFSHQELVPGRSLPTYVTVGLDLIDWLLASHSVKYFAICYKLKFLSLL